MSEKIATPIDHILINHRNLFIVAILSAILVIFIVNYSYHWLSLLLIANRIPIKTTIADNKLPTDCYCCLLLVFRWWTINWHLLIAWYRPAGSLPISHPQGAPGSDAACTWLILGISQPFGNHHQPPWTTKHHHHRASSSIHPALIHHQWGLTNHNY